MAGELGFSKNQVNKAGDVVRRYVSGADPQPTDDELMDAVRMVRMFRYAHQGALITARTGLTSSVAAEVPGAKPKVSQRLKQFMTIVSKLQREPNILLARMQDIGGCRAVLPNLAAVARVRHRLEHGRRRGVCVRTRDYIAEPRSSGYRGVHVILRYAERDIEVQLRTETMHQWAIAVERLGGRTGNDLKSGYGPEPVLQWLRLVSEAMAIEDDGGTVDETMLARVVAARAEAVLYLP